MSTLWLIILSGFLVVTDYTVQKTDINWDFTPDPKMSTEIIYYDRIEVGMDGMRTFTPDSIVYVTSRKERKKWE